MKHLNPFYFFVVILFVIVFSGCTKKYTASFNYMPAKTYTAERKAPVDEPQAPADKTLSANTVETAVADATTSADEKLKRIEEKVTENNALKAPAKKLNVVQKLVLKKVLKKAEKDYKNSLKEIKAADDSDQTKDINSNIRLGLILIVAGVIVGIFVPVVGGIVGIIGLVFLLIGLLEL